jgi:release factor glutamine methyltransferase
MKLLKAFSQTFIRPPVQKYLSRERDFRHGEIIIKILPGVFHPGFFFSTKFLIEQIEDENPYKKSLLELGAGSGLISFVAEKLGAYVTASDLSQTAIRGLEFNKQKLQSKIEIIQSDLFDTIPHRQFDFIVINPPYYRKKVEGETQLAWNCGEHFEYFEKLFSQLRRYVHGQSRILMVLSHDCDTFSIGNIAEKNYWTLKEARRKKFWWEWNYIFEVISAS